MKHKHIPALTPRAKKLRKDMTPEERCLWHCFLKNYPVRFLRQKVIDGYIADFYCAAAQIVIELDGSQHHTEAGQEYDGIRDELLRAWNIEVIRFPNDAVRTNFEGVCKSIDKIVTERIRNGK